MNNEQHSGSVSTEYIREHAKIYLEKVKTLSAKKLRREISPEFRIYINVDILRHNVSELQDTVIHEY